MLQFLTLLSSSTFGFGGAPPLMTIVTHAALLKVFEIPQDRPLAIHFSRLGSVRARSLATAQSVFNNLAFAAFFFALGKGIGGIAWLVYDLQLRFDVANVSAPRPQQPARVLLLINLKTANALGLTIPSEILALADEVIE